MGGYKNQLTGKYERKFSVSNISHIKFIIYIRKFTTVKGEFQAQYKLGSNERAWKIQKNELSLIFMCQLVLEISQFKVIFPPHKDAAIFMILSLVPIKRKSSMTSYPHCWKLWEKWKCDTRTSSKWICLKFYRLIEFVSTIQLVFKIRCHGNWNKNNGLLLKRQKLIVYTNVLTIFQLETTQFIS